MSPGITELLLDPEAVYHCHVHKLPPPRLDLNKFHLHEEHYTNHIYKWPNFRFNFFTQPKEFLFLHGRFQQNSSPSSLYLKKLSKWCDLCKLLEPCLTHSNPLFHTDFPNVGVSEPDRHLHHGRYSDLPAIATVWLPSLPRLLMITSFLVLT
jgi:hypothetical protein